LETFVKRIILATAALAFALVGPVVAAPGNNTVTVAAKPAHVVFGKSTVISGQVTGTNNAGVQVTLQGATTGGFKPVGNPVATDASGNYSFTVSPQVNTKYHVDAKTKPKAQSPDVTVTVSPKVGMSVSDKTPRKGQKVRFSGSVTPAHDGKVASVQRRTSSGWKTVKTTTLVASTPVNGIARSKYAVRVKVRRTGTYRVLVTVADTDHVDGHSRKRKLRAH
jgi:hypothetical protein